MFWLDYKWDIMMKPSVIQLIMAAFAAFLSGACTKTNNNELISGCDTVNMTYANNVVPILKYNCYTCHSVGNSVGSVGILLDSYQHLKPYTQFDSAKMASILVGNIEHDPGFVAMPYMKHKLDACSINQIVAWVNQGAPNN